MSKITDILQKYYKYIKKQINIDKNIGFTYNKNIDINVKKILRRKI